MKKGKLDKSAASQFVAGTVIGTKDFSIFTFTFSTSEIDLIKGNSNTTEQILLESDTFLTFSEGIR